MQEQIFRGSAPPAPQQCQQPPTQVSMSQMLRNTQQQRTQRSQSASQQQQQKTKIVTPTKSNQHELLAGQKISISLS
jgi:hypothetical protein